MHSNTVTKEFVNEVTARVQRLKEFASMCDRSTWSTMESNMILFQSKQLHDTKAGVPPPEDHTPDDSSVSSGNESLEFAVNSSLKDIEAIKKENARMIRDIRESLEAFKRANTKYMKSEKCSSTLSEEGTIKTTSSLGTTEDLGELIGQINALQDEVHSTTDKVSQHEDQILTKDLENLELKQRIASLELSIQAKQEQANCQCVTF